MHLRSKCYKALGFDPTTMTVRLEVLGGMTSFFTMCYILAVNPDILSASGMDKGSVFTATALSSALATLIMAFLAKVPFALAPSMGINAFFAFTLVRGMGYSWETALTAVFIEGVIFIALTLFNVREKIVASIPPSMRHAISCGIGLFIAFIGLKNGGVIVQNADSFVALGPWSANTLLAFGGILLTAFLMIKNVRGALFYAIVAITVLGIPLGVTHIPHGFSPVSMPASIAPTFLKFDFSQIFTFDMAIVIFSLVFMDLFNTLGTLIGASTKAGLIEQDGTMKQLKPAMMADALGTAIGACLGTSTVTTYVESTSGIVAGGRSGMTSLTTAIFFLVSLFFAPFFLLIPTAATTGALVIVGVMMLDAIRNIPMDDVSEAVPAFITIIMMPLCASISEGIVLGLLSYVFIKMLCGKSRQLSPTMYILAALFILNYIFA